MKISIVTISFNQARFLEQCIRSVLDQDYEDIEYIVVDPGSTDGSREIIERYRSKIDKIIFEPDDGPADGLNKGFSYATGEVFGFLNSDDVLLPGAVSQIANYFKNNPKKDVVSGHTLLIDKNDHQIRKFYSDKFSLPRYVYQAAIISQPSTFFREYMFRHAEGFNVNNKIAWDAELWVNMAMIEARFAVLNKFLSCSRVYEESISSRKHRGKEGDEYRKRIFEKVMGRNRTIFDALPKMAFRILRFCNNPKALHERVNKGPVCYSK